MCKCLNPIDAWICGTTVCKDGVISPRIEFSSTKVAEYYRFNPSLIDKNYSPMPCGKCAACQIRKRKDMTTRIAHERTQYDDCCFITLTYNDENVPKTNMVEWKDSNSIPCITRGDVFGIETLLPSDVQKFIKRLRRHLEYRPKKHKILRDYVPNGGIRYFAVGEYGGKSHRPHYHILIFGWKPSDLKIHELKNGYNVYRSSQIEKLWRYGFSTVGDVSYGVAKYCARYVTKKFARLDNPHVDEVYCCPEFTLQSTRNGGIGSRWLDKYQTNLLNGFVTVRSSDARISKCSIPKYYYNRLRKINQPLWLEIRQQRINFVKSVNTPSTAYEDLCRFVEVQRNLDKVALDKEQI